MTTADRNLVHQIIAGFAPRHVRKPRVFIPGRKSDRRALTCLGVAPFANVAMPDMVIHDLERDWLFLILRGNLIQLYGPLADTWQVWDKRNEPPSLILSSESATLSQLEQLL